MTTQTDTVRYPIGPWVDKGTYSADLVQQLVERISTLPEEYQTVADRCSDYDLRRQYRAGSWTVQQLFHHVADTHLMHFMRLKNALSTPEPTIGVIADVNAWAALDEAQTAPIQSSVTMLRGTHQRIAYLAGHLTPDQLDITYFHPPRQRNLSLPQALDIIVWHAEHHLGHIRLAMSL